MLYLYTWILDVGVVCPGTQRYVDQGSGTTPGLAAETYAAVKAAKYADQDNFIPFILETGGRVNNKAARDWLDALTAPEPGEQVPSQDDHPWNPQARTTTETVLREAMQALVRVLRTSLSSWDRSIPGCLLCWQRPLVSPLHLTECLYFKSFLS
jgi:hypothetical protein